MPKCAESSHIGPSRPDADRHWTLSWMCLLVIGSSRKMERHDVLVFDKTVASVATAMRGLLFFFFFFSHSQPRDLGDRQSFA